MRVSRQAASTALLRSLLIILLVVPFSVALVQSPADAAAGGATLRAGQSLKVPQALISPSGDHTLRLRDDGRVVLRSNGKVMWTTKASGDRLTLNRRGNLVLVSNGTRVWQSGTAGQRAARLRMQDNGNVVMRTRSGREVWSTGTARISKPQWWPLRGDNLMGCARSGTGSTCNGHHDYWALDIEGPRGQKVFASGSGIARVLSTSSGCSSWGKAVLVDHARFGSSLYAHLDSIAISTGQRVTRHSVIGRVGSTGSTSRCSYAHLHYEEREPSTSGLGAARAPGSMAVCRNGQLRSYPQAWGENTWSGLPGHRYTARNDGVRCR